MTHLAISLCLQAGLVDMWAEDGKVGGSVIDTAVRSQKLFCEDLGEHRICPFEIQKRDPERPPRLMICSVV